MSCANAPTAMKRTTIIATKEKLDLAISELCVVVFQREREVEGDESKRGFSVCCSNGERVWLYRQNKLDF